MAKKKAELKPEVVPGEPIVTAEVLEPEVEVIEAPTTLAPIVNEYKDLGISVIKINAHLIEFVPFALKFSELETELKELQEMEDSPEKVEKAKTLRSSYRSIRTGSNDTKATQKKEILVEGKFLDKLDNKITESVKEKEEICLGIEKAAEIAETERLNVIKETRKTELEALDFETDFMDLAGMSDESYSRLLESAKRNKENADKAAQLDAQAEATRLANLEKTNNRIKLITSIGLVKIPDTNLWESIEGKISLEKIETVPDETFNKFYDGVKEKYDARLLEEANAVAAEKAKTEQRTNRINALTSLGLVWGAESQTYSGYTQAISLEDINNLSKEDFTTEYNNIKKVITDIKAEQAAAQKKKDDEAAALKKKNDELAAANKKLEDEKALKAKQEKDAEDKKIAEAEALKAAPDREKFKAFYLSFKKLSKEFPEFDTEKGKEAGKRFKEAVEITIAVGLEEAKKLA